MKKSTKTILTCILWVVVGIFSAVEKEYIGLYLSVILITYEIKFLLQENIIDSYKSLVSEFEKLIDAYKNALLNRDKVINQVITGIKKFAEQNT